MCLSSAEFFLQNLPFLKNIRMQSGLDPNQVRHFVGPVLGPNCLQRRSADDNSKQIARLGVGFGKVNWSFLKMLVKHKKDCPQSNPGYEILNVVILFIHFF